MSIVVKFSSIKINAITAEVGGTKKNRVVVLLTDPSFIKNIKIVNAPNDTSSIWWDIPRTKLKVKLIKGFSKKNINIKLKIHPPMAWYPLFTARDNFPLSFFCQRVPLVIAASAPIETKTPIKGNSFFKSLYVSHLDQLYLHCENF